MNKKEQQKAMISQHITNLSKLYKDTTGEDLKNPVQFNRTLQQIERIVRAEMVDRNNNEAKPNTKEIVGKQMDRLKKLFNGKLPKGLFINTDARGYSLKIEDSERIELHRDFGGYYILAPKY